MLLDLIVIYYQLVNDHLGVILKHKKIEKTNYAQYLIFPSRALVIDVWRNLSTGPYQCIQPQLTKMTLLSSHTVTKSSITLEPMDQS